MGLAVAKLKPKRAVRTRLAKDAGKMVNTIFRFTETHKIPPSLKRRLENCTADLSDAEMKEDAKSDAPVAAYSASSGKSVPLFGIVKRF